MPCPRAYALESVIAHDRFPPRNAAYELAFQTFLGPGGLSLFDCQTSRAAYAAVVFVEPNGIEPMTSGLQSQRSPN